MRWGGVGDETGRAWDGSGRMGAPGSLSSPPDPFNLSEPAPWALLAGEGVLWAKGCTSRQTLVSGKKWPWGPSSHQKHFLRCHWRECWGPQGQGTFANTTLSVNQLSLPRYL